MPLFDARKVASVIIAGMSDRGAELREKTQSDLAMRNEPLSVQSAEEIAASQFIEAVKAGNPAAVVRAFKALDALCDAYEED